MTGEIAAALAAALCAAATSRISAHRCMASIAHLASGTQPCQKFSAYSVEDVASGTEPAATRDPAEPEGERVDRKISVFLSYRRADTPRCTPQQLRPRAPCRTNAP